MNRTIFRFLLVFLCVFLALLTLSCGQTTANKTTAQPTLVERVYAAAKDLGYKGTLQEFLAECQGADGISVTGARIDEEGRLCIATSDGNEIVLDRVVGEKGADGAPVESAFTGEAEGNGR